jgi:hypothetical protein
MSRDVPADEGFPWDKATALGAATEDTLTKSPKSGNV